MSYVFLSVPPTVPGCGCRGGGLPDRAAAVEREVEDAGVAVGARLGGIVEGRLFGCLGKGAVRLGDMGLVIELNV